jgi:predicted DNA-binding WGR domain protein
MDLICPAVLLERIDRKRNMARFYMLSIEPTLFGGAALVREWGRIGTHGRRRLDLFESNRAAQAALDILASSKVTRGYQDWAKLSSGTKWHGAGSS